MKTEVYELLERIESMLNLIKDDFEKRKAEPVSKKRWRAEEGRIYYSTNAEGLVGKKTERNNDVDAHRHRSGDYSKTTVEACKRLAVNYARQRIFDALREAEGDFVDEESKSIYIGLYMVSDEIIRCCETYGDKYTEPQWNSSESAWQAVMVSHKADLLLVWGIEE